MCCVFALPRLPRSAGFDRVCSPGWCPLYAAFTPQPPPLLLSPSLPLLASSALPTSLSFFLIPSFILSAHVFLGEAKRSHSSHNPPLKPPPPFFSITLSLSSPPLLFLSLFHSLLLLFVFFLSPLLPSACPFIFLPFLPISPATTTTSSSFSSSPIPWQRLASHDPSPHSLHSHLCPDPCPTHTYTHTEKHTHACTCITTWETVECSRVAHVFHSELSALHFLLCSVCMKPNIHTSSVQFKQASLPV